jgi:hypothetical protein
MNFLLLSHAVAVDHDQACNNNVTAATSCFVGQSVGRQDQVLLQHQVATHKTAHQKAVVGQQLLNDSEPSLRDVVSTYADASMVKTLRELDEGEPKLVEHVFRNLALYLSPPVTALDGGGQPLAALRDDLAPGIVAAYDELCLDGARLADLILSAIPFNGTSADDPGRIMVAVSGVRPEKQMKRIYKKLFRGGELASFKQVSFGGQSGSTAEPRDVVSTYADAFMVKTLSELDEGEPKLVEHVFRNLALYLSTPVTALDGAGQPLAALRDDLEPGIAAAYDELCMDGVRLADAILSEMPFNGTSAYDPNRILLAVPGVRPEKQMKTFWRELFRGGRLRNFRHLV